MPRDVECQIQDRRYSATKLRGPRNHDSRHFWDEETVLCQWFDESAEDFDPFIVPIESIVLDSHMSGG